MPKYDKRVSILEKILWYCGEVNKLTERFGRSLEAYRADFAYRSACDMCIYQIAELASRLPDDFQAKYDQIPWKLIRGMRNMVAHEYEKADFIRMWETIETDIPKLKAYCEEILRSLNVFRA